MTTDFRSLLEDLVEEVLDANQYMPPGVQSAIERARAALAEPQPEPPTNAEIHALADELLDGDSASRVDFARAVLARWGS